MKIAIFVLAALLSSYTFAQQQGHQKAETHLQMSTQECTAKGNCQTHSDQITLDANWRWLHGINGYQNCYEGNQWDSNFCPNDQECAQNCALDGVPQGDWQGTYGIQTINNGIELKFVTQGPYSKNIGSRVYLMEDTYDYRLFKLKNREFTFDVDVSNLPCGLNGALYFVEMEKDGGKQHFSGNQAGAQYGTGYCDAQCPHDIKFINGEANVEGWKPSATDPNAGTGKYGSCCMEFDIWEANKEANAYTSHPCDVDAQTRCSGTMCGDDPQERHQGTCDKDGCDFNPFRMGDETFYGAGSQFTVDTTKPMTVVTQFITSDGTDNGDLSEVKRLYVQDGKVHQMSSTNIEGLDKYNSITDAHCSAQKKVFGEPDDHAKHGGLKKMGEALERGMVLVMSLWDDHAAQMLWLDSDYPTTQPASDPGVHRGPCPTSSGVPADVENQYPNSSVRFSNVKFGAIDSTYQGTPAEEKREIF